MARLIILIISILLILSTVSCIEKPIKNSNQCFSSPGISNSSPALIRYAFISNENKINIFFTDKNITNFFEISPDFDVKIFIQEYHTALQKFSLQKKKNHEEFIRQSHKLYSVLIAPISKLIKGKEELIIDAKGFFRLIPFETLVKNDKIQAFEKTDFLIKDFDIKYLSTQNKTLSLNNKSKNEPENIFLGFAPGFEKPENRSFAVAQNMRNQFVQALPYSKKEVTEIDELLSVSSKHKTQLLLNEEASKQNLKAQLSENYKYVHIASHGFSDFKTERSPGILCAQNNGKNQTLEISEISKMKINSDLVVLSICESGLGKINQNEVRGLHTGFLEAGASNVVYSLWKVNDKRTSELMTAFYSDILKKNQPYSKALRNAKLKLLANPSTSSPNIWAPFVLAESRFIQKF